MVPAIRQLGAERLTRLGRAVEAAWGLWELCRMALLSGFRIRGAYWNWRLHTAFGRGFPPKADLIRSVLRYGAWVHRMRKLM